MNDFNQQLSLTGTGTTYSDAYQLDPRASYVDLSVNVSALAGTSPTAIVTIQTSQDKVTWTDDQVMPTFAATGTRKGRLTQPSLYMRFKVVMGGTTPTATIGLFAIGREGDGDAGDEVEATTMQNAVSATGNGTDIDVSGMSTLLLQVSGTFVGTVYFEGTIDGSTYVALYATQVGAGTIATNTTAAGLFRLPVAGLKSVRARVAWTSGTSVTVIGRASMFASATEEVMYAKLFDRIAGELLDRNLMRVTQCGDTMARITSATTTAVLAEDGDLLGIFVEVALTGTVTVYNHPSSATGSAVLILPVGTPANWYPFPKSMNQGVTVVTSAADRVVVIANT